MVFFVVNRQLAPGPYNEGENLALKLVGKYGFGALEVRVEAITCVTVRFDVGSRTAAHSHVNVRASTFLQNFKVM